MKKTKVFKNKKILITGTPVLKVRGYHFGLKV